MSHEGNGLRAGPGSARMQNVELGWTQEAVGSLGEWVGAGQCRVWVPCQKFPLMEDDSRNRELTGHVLYANPCAEH